MAIREVLTSFTFEQQRQMINLIGTDVGDASTLLTPTNVLVSGINEIVNGDVDLINQTHGMDPGTFASPSLFWDSGQGFYKVNASKIGLTSSLSISGDLEVDGDITFRAGSGTGGTLTFGDLNTDNIVFNAELTSSIVPDSTANYNLGSATKQWNNIWVDGTASIDTLTVDENSTFTGYLQVDSGDVRVPSTQTTVDLFDDYATTVEAFGAGTAIRLGATTGTLTLRNPTIVGSEATQNLFNTVATTVNAFGAATNINMGVSGGGGNTNFNILSDDVVCSGDLNVNGGELLSSENTFNLLINNNDVIIGNSGGVGTTTFNTKIVAKQSLEFTNASNNYIYIPDNEVSALHIRKTGSSIDWMQFRTDTGNERVVVWKDLYIVGNLDISGTTTTIDSTTLTVEDKNIELGNVSAPSDTTADGGGITLKGATDKTILYNNTSGNWETNIGLRIANAFEVDSSGIMQTNIQSAGNITLDSTAGFTSPKIVLSAATGEGTFANTIRVDHTNNAGSDVLVRLGNVNNSGNNSAHLFLANGFYVSPTAIDGTGAAAKILADGTIHDSIGPVRRLGQNIKSANYTLVAADAGKMVRVDNGSTITIPDNTFTAGDMVTITANSSSDVNIVEGGSSTLYNASDGTDGNVVLAARTVCTILVAEGGSGSKIYIAGGGIS